jgi:xanthine dehydrogenase accessory factor
MLINGVRAEGAHRFGLPFGGTLQLIFEPPGGNSRIDELVVALKARVPMARELEIGNGAVRWRDAHTGEGVQLLDSLLTVPMGPAYRLLVIGAGRLSQYLCRRAIGLGFDVTVCDPRSEYANAWAVDGVMITREMPDDVVMVMQPVAHAAVVALTHDPELDDLALMEALGSAAFYVGVIGSRINIQRWRERSQEHFAFAPTRRRASKARRACTSEAGRPPKSRCPSSPKLLPQKNGVVVTDPLDLATSEDTLLLTGSASACMTSA